MNPNAILIMWGLTLSLVTALVVGKPWGIAAALALVVVYTVYGINYRR